MNDRDLQPQPGTAADRSPAQRDLSGQPDAVPDRVRDQLASSALALEKAERKVDESAQNLRALALDPSADSTRLAAATQDLARHEDAHDKLKDQYESVRRISLNYQNMDPRERLLAQDVLQRVERGIEADRRWVASEAEQARVFQKSVLTEMQTDIRNLDAVRALDNVAARADDFQQRGLVTHEMNQVRAILDLDVQPEEKTDRLSALLSDFERGRVMRRTSLEQGDHGLFIGEQEELRRVWEMARDVLTQDGAAITFRNMREKFWELLHPDSEGERCLAPDKDKRIIEAARRFIEDAGYTFEVSRPGAAPRLVSDHLLSATDYRLSLQHDFPQFMIRRAGGDLDADLTSPSNLRFATSRDNLQEDAVRFFRRTASFIGEIEESVRRIAEPLASIAASADRKRVDSFADEAGRLLGDIRKWERQALAEQDSTFESIRSIREHTAIEQRRLDFVPLPSGSEFADQQELRERQEKQNLALRSTAERAEMRVTEQLTEGIGRLREQLIAIEREMGASEGWARVLKEIAERIRQLERDFGLPPR